MSRRWSRPRSRSARAALAACAAVAALGFAAPGAAAGVLAIGVHRSGTATRHVPARSRDRDGESLGEPDLRLAEDAVHHQGRAPVRRRRSSTAAITHPSLPNYIAMTAGSTGGIVTDCNACRSERAEHLSRSSVRRGRSWRGTRSRCPRRACGPTRGRYLMRHNPAVYFRHLGGTCPTSDLPMGTASARSAAPCASQEHAAGLRLPHARRLSRHARLPEVGRRRVASSRGFR